MRYFEDIEVGTKQAFGAYHVTREEVRILRAAMTRSRSICRMTLRQRHTLDGSRRQVGIHAR